MAVDYRVRLESFEGPLDLLLFLVRRAEVEVEDIPIGVITDQFMEHLSAIDRVDVEVAGEFLLMAATLMEIKSRMLARAGSPSPEGSSEDSLQDDEDPRASLIAQLLEYKRYRDAADILDARLQQWQRRFPAAAADRPESPDVDQEIDLGDVELLDLVAAFHRIVETVNLDRVGDHEVYSDDTPLELHAEDLMDRLRRDASPEGLPLARVFAGRRRAEMIGLFLAMLEMIRQRRVRVAGSDRGLIVRLCESETAADSPPEQSAAGDSGAA
ncbi:MAG: segregation/condensation protein A [Phycisphaeraceae bacterium]|nr:segregation/condensation protein A [Phycisphaeraceae bacterium]